MGLEDLVDSLGQNVLTTTVGKVIGWGRGNSVWPAQFGLACCAIEMISTATAGVDKVVPVDVYIPGCPPRPEDLLNALMILQERIKAQGIVTR